MFSQTTEYALRVMACLALSPSLLVPTVALAERTKVPAHYLAKVLQQLAGASLVTGRRGVRGGYKLARPASEITLLNVVRAVSSIERIETCPMGDRPRGDLCPLHRAMDGATSMVIDFLDGRTLEALTTEPGDGQPLCEGEAAPRIVASTSSASARG